MCLNGLLSDFVCNHSSIRIKQIENKIQVADSKRLDNTASELMASNILLLNYKPAGVLPYLRLWKDNSEGSIEVFACQLTVSANLLSNTIANYGKLA